MINVVLNFRKLIMSLYKYHLAACNVIDTMLEKLLLLCLHLKTPWKLSIILSISWMRKLRLIEIKLLICTKLQSQVHPKIYIFSTIHTILTVVKACLLHQFLAIALSRTNIYYSLCLASKHFITGSIVWKWITVIIRASFGNSGTHWYQILNRSQ